MTRPWKVSGWLGLFFLLTCAPACAPEGSDDLLTAQRREALRTFFAAERTKPLGVRPIPTLRPYQPVDAEPQPSVEELADYYAELLRDRYIVVLDRRAVLDAGMDSAAQAAKRLKVAPDQLYDHALMGFAAVLSPGQASALRHHPLVKYMHPDGLMFALDLPVPTGTNRVDADLNARAAINGSPGDESVGVTVAIVDTGISRTHPDLNVVAGHNFTDESGYDDGHDGMGHGTHCAGIVAARDNGYNFDLELLGGQRAAVGMAPGTPLVAVRVLNATGGGLVSWIISGIDWITDCVSNPYTTCPVAARSIRVASMSLGCQCDDPLYPNTCWCDTGYESQNNALRVAIEAAVAAGVTVVVAAGNSDMDTGTQENCAFSPACFDAPIVVASMTDFDGRSGGQSSCTNICGYTDDTDDQRASYSNYGDQVDLIAPGTCIESTCIGYSCWACELSAHQCPVDKPTLCHTVACGSWFECCNSQCKQCSGTCVSCSQEMNGLCFDQYNRAYCCFIVADYAEMSGTSMATPAVAGGAALFIADYLRDHGDYPDAATVKAGLNAAGEQHPCLGGSDCSNLTGVRGLFAGELRDSIEVSGYSVDLMLHNGAYVADQVTGPFADGAQSLHLGVNDQDDEIHGYVCAQFCLNRDELASPNYDLLQARFQLQHDQLVNWTAFGISGRDASDVDAWLTWWWVRADGSVLDLVDRFNGDAVFNTGSFQDVAITVDRSAGTASLSVDGREDAGISLANWESSSLGMRCLFVMSGIEDDTVQDLYVDRVYLRAGPGGTY